ncbi:hypothetical protein [Bifidobacterium longum]|uniref:hypothetical protein n=1 Tax=Bifidobacterium longum TaxID=216816 RepID=UPI001F297566|nr:hypothetical protein [Bifidobacterium longum]
METKNGKHPEFTPILPPDTEQAGKAGRGEPRFDEARSPPDNRKEVRQWQYTRACRWHHIYRTPRSSVSNCARKLAKYADDSLTIPLNIDVDDANWTAAKRPINNDRLSKTVEVRGDTSALRKAVQDIEERDISPRSI